MTLGSPAGDNNRFADNEFHTSLHDAIESESAANDGHERVTEGYEAQERRAEDDLDARSGGAALVRGDGLVGTRPADGYHNT